uniref:Uncharacterized protein n=1 Tax=Anguilla anguilla TaxID=7936 RepID=A0A0E9TW28_ANGAN
MKRPIKYKKRISLKLPQSVKNIDSIYFLLIGKSFFH